MRQFALPLCAALLVGTGAYAQDPPPTQQQDPQIQDVGGGRGGPAREPAIRPYERVITKDAQSKAGVFTVHRIKDRLYYEIPKEQLGREFLWVSQIKSTKLGAGQGGRPRATASCAGNGAATACSCACRTSRSSTSPRWRSPG